MERYEQLWREALQQDLATEQANLRSLATDERFASVLHWLFRHKLAYVAEMAKQRHAEFHGMLAHAGGSVHAIETLDGELRELLKPKKQGQRPFSGR